MCIDQCVQGFSHLGAGRGAALADPRRGMLACMESNVINFSPISLPADFSTFRVRRSYFCYETKSK